MMRNSGSLAPPTAAPSRAVRRLTIPATGALTSVSASLTSSSRRSPSRDLRSASATESAFWAEASWARAVRKVVSRCSIVAAAMTCGPSLAARS